MSYTLHNGDCLEVLRTIPDNSIDAVVTDPPYGLSFMGKKWDYDVPSEDIWRECLRVLKPGGHLLAFAGTRTQHRMAVRIEDAGFEIRDMIAWVYGSGFPKSHNLKDQWQGWGTALKPALEPITVARKPLTGTVAANVLEWGTGGINVDGCRVGYQNAADKKTSVPGGKTLKHSGWNSSSSLIETRPPNDLGRFPANLIHDGSDEVVGLFPETAGANPNYVTTKYEKDSEHLKKLGASTPFFHEKTKGSAARFFYCAKASKHDRDEGCEGMAVKPAGAMSGAETRPDRPTNHPLRSNHHPTVKPTDLMRYLCRLVTPPGGIVLDPFTGSGSTGKAAILEGLQFIGIEREAEYVEIARARIEHALNSKPNTLF
jgi:site-specific DNA-methyltransferase (adenine-specific)